MLVSKLETEQKEDFQDGKAKKRIKDCVNGYID